jgi:hypothetical protein
MKLNPIKLALLAAFAPRFAVADDGGGVKTKFCDKDADSDTGVVSFQFGDGTKMEINVDSLPTDIQRTLMLHGMLQKGGDSYAGAKGNFAEAKANLQAVFETLISGQWTGGRDGEGKPRLGELSAAIARVKGIKLEDATAAVNAANESGEEGQAKIKTWRAHPKIKAAIAAARAEKAQAEAEAQEGGELDV